MMLLVLLGKQVFILGQMGCKRQIEIRLGEPGIHSIDDFERGGVRDGDFVGRDADDGTCDSESQ